MSVDWSFFLLLTLIIWPLLTFMILSKSKMELFFPETLGRKVATM